MYIWNFKVEYYNHDHMLGKELNDESFCQEIGMDEVVYSSRVRSAIAEQQEAVIYDSTKVKVYVLPQAKMVVAIDIKQKSVVGEFHYNIHPIN